MNKKESIFELYTEIAFLPENIIYNIALKEIM
jgi:hypothetical protein